MDSLTTPATRATRNSRHWRAGLGFLALLIGAASGWSWFSRPLDEPTPMHVPAPSAASLASVVPLQAMHTAPSLLLAFSAGLIFALAHTQEPVRRRLHGTAPAALMAASLLVAGFIWLRLGFRQAMPGFGLVLPVSICGAAALAGGLLVVSLSGLGIGLGRPVSDRTRPPRN